MFLGEWLVSGGCCDGWLRVLKWVEGSVVGFEDLDSIGLNVS